MNNLPPHLKILVSRLEAMDRGEVVETIFGGKMVRRNGRKIEVVGKVFEPC